MLALAAAFAALPCPDIHYSLADAKRVVLADVRLTERARREGTVVKVEAVSSSPRGWSMRAYAVPPCARRVAVCSNLLGHYAVRRTDLALENLDAGFDGRAVNTSAVRKVRRTIAQARCRGRLAG